MKMILPNNPKSWLLLAAFIALVMASGAFIGTQTAPGDWYAALNKPPFNPPNWIFAPVWSLLYILIAYAGWRAWTQQTAALPRILWAAQMVLNWLWSPVFFALQAPGPALIIICAMWCAIIGFIVTMWTRDRLSALVFVPYLLWVSFATILNMSIVFLN